MAYNFNFNVLVRVTVKKQYCEIQNILLHCFNVEICWDVVVVGDVEVVVVDGYM